VANCHTGVQAVYNAGPTTFNSFEDGDDMTDYRPAATRYDTMPYRRCGRSGLKLPPISLGLWYNFGALIRSRTAAP